MLKCVFFITLFLAGIFYSPAVFAEGKYSIKQMTPQVQAALDNRRSRFEQLRALKGKGVVGENNHGYLQVLVADPQASALVEAENSDRRVIYNTIAQQNGLTQALGAIESVFAQVQADKAEAGDKVQTEDGRWISK